jgi:hypothetical protein
MYFEPPQSCVRRFWRVPPADGGVPGHPDHRRHLSRTRRAAAALKAGTVMQI